MNKIQELQRNIKNLNVNYLMRQLFLDDDFKKLIIYLNTEKQLFEKGIDANNKILRSEFARFSNVYANRTIIEKEAKNQPTDRVTLKDTGEFYKSYKVELTSNNDLLIVAQTLKEDTDLIKVWGEDILGLTDESLQVVIDSAREILIPIIQKEILGKAA